MLPLIESTNHKIIRQPIYFKGLNMSKAIKPGELTYTKNLSSNLLPCMSPRPSRERVNQAIINDPQALFATEDGFAWVDGAGFYYKGELKGEVTAGPKSMTDFNGNILIMPDRKYYNYIDDVFGNMGSGLYPTAGAIPEMDFICTHMNRVFGCKGNDLYASALGSFTDWTTFEGLSTDAWATDVASEGNFTGIVAYLNHVIFTKDDFLHELFGDKPSNFRAMDPYKSGCVSNKSLQEVDTSLFMLGREGVKVYSGSFPEVISHVLGERKYVDGVAGEDGRKYYISLYDGEMWELFVYDTLTGTWFREDGLHVIQFAKQNGVLYALTADGDILKFGSGDEIVSWSGITEIFTEETQFKKGHNELFFRVELEPGSLISIYVKYGDGDFALVKTYDTPGYTAFTIPLRITRADHFQVKIEGAGRAVVHQMIRNFYVGSER